MIKTNVTKTLSLILCTVLIAAMALFTTGCSDNTQTKESTMEADREIVPGGAVPVLGEGETVFMFSVFDLEGRETAFEIHTDETHVGAALLELGLITGDMGDFGLYVKTVNGIAADYDVDKTYWAFYINGEYAMSGVDTTEIAAGSSYAFKVEK